MQFSNTNAEFTSLPFVVLQIIPGEPEAFSSKSPVSGQQNSGGSVRGRRRTRKAAGNKSPECRYKGCSATFSSKDELKTHVTQNHRSTKHSLVCNECGQVFATSTGLRFHMSVHTGKQTESREVPLRLNPLVSLSSSPPALPSPQVHYLCACKLHGIICSVFWRASGSDPTCQPL